MDFYQALQLPPLMLKQKIKEGKNQTEKRFYQTAIVIRSFLMVAFSIAYILLMTTLFGQEQSTLAVVLLCMLLSLRVVDFGYRVEQSLLGLAVVFLLLLFAPQVAAELPPILQFLCHLSALFIIFLLTSYDRQLGNPSLYGFCYIFLVGTLPGKEFFANRSLLMFGTYVFFGLIYFRKHRHKHRNLHFHQRVFSERFWTENNLFLFCLALGISLFFLLMAYYPMERSMWAGFACSSLLAGQRNQLRSRSKDRVLGAILGSLGFFLLLLVLPEKGFFLIGPLGGFALGLVTTYRNQTIINCFGALYLARQFYAVEVAVGLRMFANLLGVVFALGYLLSLRLLFQVIQPLKIRFSKEID
ncbi:FUSC family protein [Enterococcus sp. LJL98]